MECSKEVPLTIVYDTPGCTSVPERAIAGRVVSEHCVRIKVSLDLSATSFGHLGTRKRVLWVKYSGMPEYQQRIRMRVCNAMR